MLEIETWTDALLVVGGPDSLVAVTVTSEPVPSAASAGAASQTATRPVAPLSNASVRGSKPLTSRRPSTATMRKVAAGPTFLTANTTAADVPGTTSSGRATAVTSTVSSWNKV